VARIVAAPAHLSAISSPSSINDPDLTPCAGASLTINHPMSRQDGKTSITDRLWRTAGVAIAEIDDLAAVDAAALVDLAEIRRRQLAEHTGGARRVAIGVGVADANFACRGGPCTMRHERDGSCAGKNRAAARPGMKLGHQAPVSVPSRWRGPGARSRAPSSARNGRRSAESLRDRRCRPPSTAPA